MFKEVLDRHYDEMIRRVNAELTPRFMVELVEVFIFMKLRYPKRAYNLRFISAMGDCFFTFDDTEKGRCRFGLEHWELISEGNVNLHHFHSKLVGKALAPLVRFYELCHETVDSRLGDGQPYVPMGTWRLIDLENDPRYRGMFDRRTA